MVWYISSTAFYHLVWDHFTHISCHTILKTVRYPLHLLLHTRYFLSLNTYQFLLNFPSFSLSREEWSPRKAPRLGIDFSISTCILPPIQGAENAAFLSLIPCTAASGIKAGRVAGGAPASSGPREKPASDTQFSLLLFKICKLFCLFFFRVFFPSPRSKPLRHRGL